DFPFEDFGPVDVGSAAERTLVVGNFGLSPANNIFMSLNPVESDFSYAGGTCGAVIAPLASCRVIIRFEPKEKRQYQTNPVIVYFNGAGTPNSAIRELRAEGVENPLRPATGDEHTCAVVENGTVKCWGLNDNGQLGDGTKTTRYAPAPVHYFGKKG